MDITAITTPGAGPITAGATPITGTTPGGDGTIPPGAGVGDGHLPPGRGVTPDITPGTTRAIGVSHITASLRLPPTVRALPATTTERREAVAEGMATPHPARRHARAIARRPLSAEPLEAITEARHQAAIPISAPDRQAQGPPAVTGQATPARQGRQATATDITTREISAHRSRPATAHTTTPTAQAALIPTVRQEAIPAEDVPEDIPAEEDAPEAEEDTAAADASLAITPSPESIIPENLNNLDSK